jgi:CubicO group peptidase (beta-lactamase class C family)
MKAAAVKIIVAGMLVAAIGISASAESPKSIASSLQSFVDNRSIAGAVALVADKDQILSFDAVGFADLEQEKPMRPESLFWIASMTKPVTATAVLMLQDEGKLLVDDSVEK